MTNMSLVFKNLCVIVAGEKINKLPTTSLPVLTGNYVCVLIR